MHQQQNNDKTSASKSRLNFNLKILTKPQLLEICNQLLPTRSLSSTLATVTTSASFELAFLHANIVFFKLRISYLSSCTSPQVSTRKGNGELRAPRRRGMQENLQLSLSLQIIPASSSTFTNLRKASILNGSHLISQ